MWLGVVLFSKVDAVQAFPIPRTNKQVRAFLGLMGYYRQFIPDYATIAVPLTNLTKTSTPNQFSWTQECDISFNRLKELLCSSPILQTPDFTRPFILQTDASDRGQC